VRSNLEERGHFARFAAEADRRKATAPVRAHDDQAAAFRSGGRDGRPIKPVALDMTRVTRAIRSSCSFGNGFEYLRGVRTPIA